MPASSAPSLSASDLDFLERYAREATPGPRGCEAGEPVPGEHFYVTGPTPGVAAALQDGVFGEVLMSADKHGDAVLAAFLTQERVLSLIAMARRAPRWIPVEEVLPDESRDVLALLSDGSAVVASRTGSDWAAWGVDRESGELAYTSLWQAPPPVTHWMPILAPPKGP